MLMSGRSLLRLAREIWSENSGLDRIAYAFSAMGWQARKRLRMHFQKRICTGAVVPVRPSSAYSSLFYFRWPEAKDILFLRRHADLAPTFIDVGANVGLFTAHLYDRFDRFVLFEPAADSAESLRDLAGLNAAREMVVHQVAVAASEGRMAFLDEGGQSTTNRLVRDAKSGQPPGPRLVDVTVTTLDRALSAQAGDLVAKIDVEGFEEDVFRGADGLLRAQRIKLVMFERLGRTNLANIERLLSGHGYVVFYVTPAGKVSTARGDVERPLVNLFACPQDVFEKRFA
jgi:FkbM family methyltransferase